MPRHRVLLDENVPMSVFRRLREYEPDGLSFERAPLGIDDKAVIDCAKKRNCIVILTCNINDFPDDPDGKVRVLKWKSREVLKDTPTIEIIRRIEKVEASA